MPRAFQGGPIQARRGCRPVWPEDGDVSETQVIVYVQKRTWEEHPWPLPREKK